MSPGRLCQGRANRLTGSGGELDSTGRGRELDSTGRGGELDYTSETQRALSVVRSGSSPAKAVRPVTVNSGLKRVRSALDLRTSLTPLPDIAAKNVNL